MVSLPARSHHRSIDRNVVAWGGEENQHDQRPDRIAPASRPGTGARVPPRCSWRRGRLVAPDPLARPVHKGRDVHDGRKSLGAEFTSPRPEPWNKTSTTTLPRRTGRAVMGAGGADDVLPPLTAGNSGRLEGFFRIFITTDERSTLQVGKAGLRIRAASQTASGTVEGFRMPHTRPSARWTPGLSKWP